MVNFIYAQHVIANLTSSSVLFINDFVFLTLLLFWHVQKYFYYELKTLRDGVETRILQSRPR